MTVVHGRDQVDQRERCALVRHVEHFDAGHALEQFACQMRGGAVAGGGITERIRFVFGERDQVLDRFHRQRGMHDQDAGDDGDHGHRGEILADIVRQVFHQADVDGVAGRAQQQGVAVGGGLGDDVRAEYAAGAGAVVDQDALAQCLGESRRQGARGDVHRSAGGKGHDEAYRLVWVIRSDCRGQCRAEQQRNQREAYVHRAPPCIFSRPWRPKL
jgi:hypothetical protein